MKVKELIERLQNVNPEAEIWVSAHNKANTATYGLMDQIFEFNFENLWPDLQNTFRDIDERLIDGKQDKDKIILLDTSLGR